MTALIGLFNQKRAGERIVPKEKPATNVVDDGSLRRSVGQEVRQARQEAKKGIYSGQKEDRQARSLRNCEEATTEPQHKSAR
ncbi:hypothetical protein RAD15_31715 [Bradyrhizobium sp. 14AA]